MLNLVTFIEKPKPTMWQVVTFDNRYPPTDLISAIQKCNAFRTLGMWATILPAKQEHKTIDLKII